MAAAWCVPDLLSGTDTDEPEEVRSPAQKCRPVGSGQAFGTVHGMTVIPARHRHGAERAFLDMHAS